jgi:imidazolonepropionase-like amidohydrolase
MVRNKLKFGGKGLAVVAAAALGILGLAQPAAAQSGLGQTTGQPPLIIKGGWLFTGTSDKVIKNTGVLVVSGRIMAINRPLTAVETAGAKTLQLKDDEYVLPGLIDVHAHYNMTLGPRGIRSDELKYNPTIFLANGVTGTFPAGEFDPEGMRQLRERIDNGQQVGPRLYNSGPYYGTARPGWDKNTTPEDIYKTVDEWAAKGARAFKAKGANPQQLRALIERAHQHGLKVTGHLGSGDTNGTNARDAILMGIDRVEHIMGGDQLDPKIGAYDSWVNVDTNSKAFKDISALFISHNVTYDPTIMAPTYFIGPKMPGLDYWTDETRFFTPDVQAWAKSKPTRPNPLFEKLFVTMKRTTKAFYDAGGTISMGTDAPSSGAYLAGFGAHRELDALVSAGLPPAAAIKAGTMNSAKTLGVSDLVGSIEVGKLADMFVITGNPLTNIRNTRTVHTVIKSGVVYDSKTLLDSVVGKIPMSPQRPEGAPARPGAPD